MRCFVLGTLVLAIFVGAPGLVRAQEFSAPDDELIWFRADYLYWWVKSAPLPTLVTTDPSNGATPTAGGLADPTTRVVIGDASVRYNGPGARFEGGAQLIPGFGLEGSYFFLGRQNKSLIAGSDPTGNPFLFRPFINVDTGNPNAGGIVSLPPGVLAGAVQVHSTTEMWGTGVNLLAQGPRTDAFRLDFLVGFRYLDLHEKLDIDDRRTDLSGIGIFNNVPTAPGDRFVILDSFHTRSQFYGGQVGVRGETSLGRLVLGGDLRVSLGNTHQMVNVFGSTTLLPLAGGSATLPGGILALPSNGGARFANDFTAIPELGLNVGYDVTDWLRLNCGYDLIYWNRVVRPGDQVPIQISASQLPTALGFTGPGTVPPPVINRTDFWAQGIHVGVALRF